MPKYLANLDLNRNQLQNAAIQNLTGNPATAVEGQVYYNTTEDRLYIYANGAWSKVPISQDVAGAYVLPVANATTLGGVKDGAGVDIDAEGIISHSDTSSAANLTASGRTYVTGLAFDGYGHVQSYTTATESVVDTNTTYDLIGAINTGGAKVMLNGSDASSDAVIIKGLGATSVTYANSAIEITSTDTTYTNGAGLNLSAGSFSHADTSSAANVTASGRTYLTGITFDTYGHVQGTTTATETVTDTNTQYTVGAAAATGGANISINYSGTPGANSAVILKGLSGITVGYNNSAVEISGTTYTNGAGLTLTGNSFSHTDTSSAANLAATARTYVTGLAFDTYGHVQSYTTATESVTDTNNYTTAVSWTGGTTAGPNLILQRSGLANIGAVIPTATSSTSGIVTSDAQTFGGDKTFNNNVIITGNLTVQGDTITVNTATMQVEDPIITLGGTTAPGADDGKDKGIEFRWFNSTAKVGFFGLDRSTGKFTFIPDATNTNEVFSGTKGTIDANIEWADVLSKPDPVITVTLTGDVTGSGSATLSDLASNTVSFATTIAANSVALGTDTTGNYLATLADGTPGTQTGTSGLTITAAAGEGTAATIAHADTSTLTGAQGTAGIASITVDGLGHVTAVTTATYMRRYATTITSSNSTDTSHIIPHGLGTQDVMVNIYKNTSTFDQVFADVQHTNSAAVTVLLATDTAATDYRVVVIG